MSTDQHREQAEEELAPTVANTPPEVADTPPAPEIQVQGIDEESVSTPITTPPAPDLDDPLGEFARLIPSNRLARLAFSQVVEAVLHDTDGYAQVRKFMRFSAAPEEDATSELSDAADFGPEPLLRIWGGYYVLDLKTPPQRPPIGWVLGSIAASRPTDHPDLLLAPKHGRYRVGSKHARLTLHRDTGILLACVGHRAVSISSSFGTVRLKDSDRALTEAASIQIGDLQYDFVYQDSQSSSHKADLEHYMRTELGHGNFQLSSSVSSLGSDTDTQLKDYTIKTTFAAGTSAMVSGAIVKATGQLVAVKKMSRPSRQDPTIASEKTTLERLHAKRLHPRICHIREIIQNGPIEETYIIYTPFLYGELYKMLRLSSFGDDARVKVCTQLLEALAWIHENGIMHRDLKPQNMGLRSSSPPEAVVFDFGHATFDEASMDHMKGTIWYLAPEVLDIKYRRSRQPYDRAVDVWSMGLSLYQLICHGRGLWTGLEIHDRSRKATDYSLAPMNAVLKELNQSPLTEPAGIIQSMLEIDSRLRISAKDAWNALSNQPQDKDVPASKRQKVT